MAAIPFQGGTAIGTAAGASGASISINIGAAGVPPGSLIVVGVTEKNTAGTSGSVADTAGNTYNASQSGNLAATAADGHGMVFFVFASKALVNGNSITYTRQLSASKVAMSAWYYGGVQTGANPEVTGARNSATGTTGALTVTSAAGSQGSIFVGVLCDSGTSTAGGNATFTQAAGWTPSGGYEINSGGSGGVRVDAGQLLASGSGTQTYNPSLSSTAQQWILFITAFKLEPGVANLFPQSDWGVPPDPSAIWGPTALQAVPDVIINKLLQPVDLSNYLARSPIYVPKPPWDPPWGPGSIGADPNQYPPISLPFSNEWFAQYTFEPDKFWLGVPISAPFNLLGGQPPTPQWRYDWDSDTKLWLASPTDNPALLQLVEPFSNEWYATYTFEPDKFWLGHPTSNQLPGFFALPFSKQWEYNFEPDKYWQGFPIANRTPQFFAPPFYKLWRYDYNTELPQWQGAPEPADTLFMLVEGGSPFSKQWEYNYEPDKLWTGTPLTAHATQLFQAQPFFKQWEYNYVPEPFWQGAPDASDTLYLLVEGGEPFSNEWSAVYTFEPDKYWLGTPINVADPLFILTSGGQPFHRQTRYDYVPDPVWQGSPIGNIPIEEIRPFSKQWEYHFEPDKYWQWQGPSSNTLAILVEGGEPFSKEWTAQYTYNTEFPQWQGSPLRSFTIQVTPTEPFSNEWAAIYTTDPDVREWVWAPPGSHTLDMLVEGGQPFHKQWEYHWNTEYPQWQGAPTAAQILIDLAHTPTSPTKQWRYDYDPDVRFWQGNPIPRPPEYISPLAPFFKQWEYNWDSGATNQWDGSPLVSWSMRIPQTNPLFKLWRYDYEADKFWQGAPRANFPIEEIRPTFKLWRYDYEPDKYWMGHPVANIPLEEIQPFSKQWEYHYVPEPVWQGSPIANRVPQYFAEPFSKLWRYDYQVDWVGWQGSPVANVPVFYSVEFLPHIPYRYPLYATDPFWQGTPIPGINARVPQQGVEPFIPPQWEPPPEQEWWYPPFRYPTILRPQNITALDDFILPHEIPIPGRKDNLPFKTLPVWRVTPLPLDPACCAGRKDPIADVKGNRTDAIPGEIVLPGRKDPIIGES